MTTATSGNGPRRWRPRGRAARICLGLVAGLALAGAAHAQRAPRIDDASGVEVNAGRSGRDRPPPAPPDRRALYVAGAVLALGAFLLWNRRQRAELEREHGETTRRDRRRNRRRRLADLADLASTAPPDERDDQEPTP